MKAVSVSHDRSPVYGDIDAPAPQGDLAVVEICAAALTNLDIAIAEGRHYLSPATLPAVVGREGVVRAGDGRRLYLNVNAIPVPWGSMAERTLADLRHALPIPDAIDDALAAAIGNPGLAAWLPLSWRARMRPGETVLILGATGTTGMMAVAAARKLGAGRIIAAGRNLAALDAARKAGADESVVLDGSDPVARFRAAAGGDVDIVLDYLNGPPAEAALGVMGVHGRMVQIGSGLAPGIMLPAQIARKQSLDILGFAYYHAPIEEQRAAYAAMCDLAREGRIMPAIETCPLREFGTAWDQQKSGTRKRMVLIP